MLAEIFILRPETAAQAAKEAAADQLQLAVCPDHVAGCEGVLV
jgi:hypothetical protein